MQVFHRLSIRARLMVAVLIPILLTAAGIAWYAIDQFDNSEEA